MTTTPNTAPGEDGIPNRALIWTWDVAADEYYICISKCMRTGYHPSAYHRSISPAVQKPGKAHYSNPRAWRLVHLLSTMGKWIEKFIATRLLYYAMKHRLIPLNQFGAMPGKSTTDAALYHHGELVHKTSDTHQGCQQNPPTEIPQKGKQLMKTGQESNSSCKMPTTSSYTPMDHWRRMGRTELEQGGYYTGMEWNRRVSEGMRRHAEVYDAEMLGLLRGLETAIVFQQVMPEENRMQARIVLFVDNTSLVAAITSERPGQAIEHHRSLWRLQHTLMSTERHT